MTLFCELYAMAKTCSLSMLITADASTGKLTVNVLPKPKSSTGANADAQEAALTQPLCLTATPEEFDQDFLAALRNYRECHHSLSQQAAATCDLLKAAKDASAKKAAAAVTKVQRPAGKGASTASSASGHASHGSADEDGDSNDDAHREGNRDEPDSLHEDDGHAAEDGVTGGSPAVPSDAGQPQLFG